MELINKFAENYAEQFTSANDNYLRLVYNATIKNHPKNHMQSNWVQGMFLKQICKMSKSKFVLEIGTFTGFSALCLANGLSNEGQLHTIELRDEDAKTAKQNFEQSTQKNKIHLHIGEAKNIITTLKYNWDLVYVDADKTGYKTYLDLVLPNLSDDGIIIVDNVLFHGEVIEDNIKGKNAKAIHEFNQYVIKHPLLECVFLTIRDGLMLIQKKK